MSDRKECVSVCWFWGGCFTLSLCIYCFLFSPLLSSRIESSPHHFFSFFRISLLFFFFFLLLLCFDIRVFVMDLFICTLFCSCFNSLIYRWNEWCVIAFHTLYATQWIPLPPFVFSICLSVTFVLEANMRLEARSHLRDRDENQTNMMHVTYELWSKANAIA